jgi:hypothetical protein
MAIVGQGAPLSSESDIKPGEQKRLEKGTVRQHPDLNMTQLITLSGYGRKVDREPD